MKKIVKNTMALFLVALMIMSSGPLEGFIGIDFLSPFKTIASAIEKVFEPAFVSDIQVNSIRRANCDKNSLNTQANELATLTLGDEVDLNVNVVDQYGNPISNYGTVSWSASPSDAASVSTWSDSRYCTVTITSSKYRSVTITASVMGRSSSFTFAIAGLTFDKDEYFILVDDTALVDDLTNILANSCFAIWTYDGDSSSASNYHFSSSNEGVLKINGNGRYIPNSKSVFYYPSVLGVEEGETTLTITAPDGQKASCAVKVVGLKEYTIETRSKELDISLADSDLSYHIRRAGSVTTQSDTSTKTDSNGLAVVRLPDAKICPVTLNISSEYHKDKEISSSTLVENGINSVPLDMEDVDVSDIDSGADSLKGPTINVFGKDISLFDVAVKGELSIGNTQIKINNQQHKIEILIGLENISDSAYVGPDGQTTNYWSESYRDVKELYQKVTGEKVDNTKLWNQFSKLRGKLKKIKGSLGVDVSASLAGYIQFSYTSGKIHFDEGGIIASAGVGLSLEAKFPPFPAVYGTFSLSIDTSGKILLSHGEDFNFDVRGVFTLDLTASLGIGVGDKKVASTYLEGGFTGTLSTNLDMNFTPFSGAFSASLTADLYLKGEAVGFEILDKTWPFYDKQLYPKEESVSTKAIGGSISEALKTAKPLTRDYLNKNVVYTNSMDYDYSKTSLYPYSEPQLYELNNGKKVLIWIDDLGNKNDVNKTSIMYNVYDGKKWLTEKTVYEDGTYSGSPKAYCDGEKVYVIWQKANNKLSESATMDSLLNSIDLYYSCFGGTSFSTPVQLTNSNKFEMMYNISVKSGKVLVTWVENSDNNIFLSSGTNSVFYKTIDNGIVSTSQKVYSTNGNLTDITSSDFGNNTLIAFTVEGSDNSLFLYKNGNVKKIAYSSSSGYTNLIFNNGKLYYLYDNHLNCYDVSTGNSKCYDSAIIKNFSIISNNNRTIILTLVSDGFKCELFAYDLDGDQFSTIYQLSNFDKYIRSYSAYIDKNNEIQLAANLVDVTNNINNVFSTSTMAVTSCSELKDISIENYVYVNYGDICPGENLPLAVDVRNNGKSAINSFNIVVKDESTLKTANKTINETIRGGETKTIDFNYLVPASFSKRSLSIEIKCEGDVDDSNNKTNVIIGNADVCLQNCSINKDYTINTSIKNDGYSVAKSVVLSVYKLEDEYELIYEKNIGDINANSVKSISYSVDKSLIEFDSYLSNNLFKVSVSTSEEETDYSNNVKELMVSPVRVSDISLDRSSVTMLPNSTWQMNVSVIPLNATTKTVLWFSNDPDIASVDNNGKITAHKYGSTKIKCVSIDGRFEDYCTVTVSSSVPVEKIVLNTNKTGLKVGSTLQLTADILPSNATNKNISWSTNNSKVATVSSNGLVTAKAEGTAIITAEASNGINTICVISVSKVAIPVISVTVSPSQISVVEGNQIQLSATVYPSNATNQNIGWSSKNPSIADVSESGLVTAKTPGSTEITVTTDDGGFKAKCTVTVTSKTVSVTGVTITPDKVSLSKGDTKQLVANVFPSNATNKTVTWYSNNESIATVNSNGVVTAVKEGITKIYAVTVDGKFEAVCDISVSEPISIKVSKMPQKTTYTYKIDSFDKSGMEIEVLYSDGSKETIKDTSKFKVSEIPKKKGNHSLDVTYKDLKAKLNITVKYAWWQWIIKILLFGWIWY